MQMIFENYSKYSTICLYYLNFTSKIYLYSMPVNQPLADRLRPTSLDEYVGQDHLVGKNSILRASIKSGNLPGLPIKQWRQL